VAFHSRTRSTRKLPGESEEPKESTYQKSIAEVCDKQVTVSSVVSANDLAIEGACKAFMSNASGYLKDRKRLQKCHRHWVKE
jgi:hypothetical protein